MIVGAGASDREDQGDRCNAQIAAPEMYWICGLTSSLPRYMLLKVGVECMAGVGGMYLSGMIGLEMERARGGATRYLLPGGGDGEA